MTAFRFKSTRPVYRRGGLLLSSAGWVEVAADDLGKDAHIALLEDPVVMIQIAVSPPGDWEVLGLDDRRFVAQHLRFDHAEAPLVPERASAPVAEPVAGVAFKAVAVAEPPGWVDPVGAKAAPPAAAVKPARRPRAPAKPKAAAGP